MWRYAAMVIALAVRHAPIQSIATSDRVPRESVVGRWDLTVEKPEGVRPSWLEIHSSGRAMLVGRVVGEVGSARPIARIDLNDRTIGFAVPPQWENGDGDLSFEGTIDGNQLSDRKSV